VVPGLELPPLLPCDGLVGGVLPRPPVTAFLPPEPPPEPPLFPAIARVVFPLPPPPPPDEVTVLSVEAEPFEPCAGAVVQSEGFDPPAPPAPTVTV